MPDCLISDLRTLNTEVIVVDNASTDGSAAMVRERFPWVRLIENRENAGFARANNQAIVHSRGRYLLLLNSDTLVHPDALETLIAFMDAHPQTGACGPRLLNGDGSLQHACHPMLTPGREFWRLAFLERLWPRATYPMSRWDTATPRRVEVIKGACLLLRRAAIDQVGLLDDRYFMYTEEVDLCYRLAQAGWGLWYEPRAVVTHFGEASSKQVREEMYLQLYRSKAQFYRKFGGRPRVELYKALLALATLPRAAAASLAGTTPSRLAATRPALSPAAARSAAPVTVPRVGRYCWETVIVLAR
jgi:N-acetylglucosaminyl-diphospho-decaprenol L-rhamnosyltransferase